MSAALDSLIARAEGLLTRLEAEALVDGYWPYPVLVLSRTDGPDPAYAGLPLAAALRFGPRLLREGHPLLRRVLADAYGRYAPAAAPGRPAERELRAVLEALTYLGWNVDEWRQG